MLVNSNLERWLSVDEIAIHLGVSKVSIYKWVEAGKVPAHKVGRQWKFKASEVDVWVKSGSASEIILPNFTIDKMQPLGEL